VRDVRGLLRQDELEFVIFVGSTRFEPARVAGWHGTGRLGSRRGCCAVVCGAVSVRLFRFGRRTGVSALSAVRVYVLREQHDDVRACDA
jgi:hypothetical protein